MESRHLDVDSGHLEMDSGHLEVVSEHLGMVSEHLGVDSGVWTPKDAPGVIWSLCKDYNMPISVPAVEIRPIF